MFPLFDHIFHQEIVLLFVPVRLQNVRVQIVIPVLSTLLGGFEVLFARDTEEIPRDLIPVRIDLVSFLNDSPQ